ncbi:MAG: GTPase HflX [Rhizobiaceae bacterium]|nr:GTPase HflX [Rhizobiaceae bacterium]
MVPNDTTPGGGVGGKNGSGDLAGADAVRAVIVVPVITRRDRGADDAQSSRRSSHSRTPDARLDEAVGLALAIDLEPVHTEIVQIAAPKPATLMGTGKVAALADVVADCSADLVVVDQPLSPVQQRNLESALKAKVLDRTGLILEIFGRRARTKEGVLQVDLAHLEYQRGRLVRSWTHLERQRGGGGFMGGPGETQIEADRRQLQEKIIRLKRELETVRRTRDLHRTKRQKVPYPVVAIVGYTNAGKSTLFNRLTGASVMAEDLLFATLDPTLRRLVLPLGTEIILSDTVGFISDLPTHLVAAFRATLEEVVEADLVVHLRDISDPDTRAQAEDVERILTDLGVDASDHERVLEVWNKIDLLDEEGRERIGQRPGRKEPDQPVAISAVSGEGIDRLVATIEQRLAGRTTAFDVSLAPDQLHLTDWLYRSGDVLDRLDREDGGLDLKLRTTATRRAEIEAKLATPAKG